MTNFFKKSTGPSPEVIKAREFAKSQAEHFLTSARKYHSEGNIFMAISQAMKGLQIARFASSYLAVTDQLTEFVAAVRSTRPSLHRGRSPVAKAA